MEPGAKPERIVKNIEARAQCFETPNGDGVMVWRKWGSGPPLLLLHGAHGAWSHWIRNIPYFEATHSVWAPDLPGCGDSDMPPDPTTGDGVASIIVDGLRLLLGNEAPVDIVGFSLGGVMAAHVAALAPELVRRLILVATGGLATPSGDRPMASLKGLEDPDKAAAAHRHNLLAIMIHDPDNLDDLALYLQSINAVRGRLYPRPLVLPDRLILALPRSTTPVDAIWGEFDGPNPDPAVQCAALRTVRPNADFRVVAGAGHWTMYEGADVFNPMLADMLRTPATA